MRRLGVWMVVLLMVGSGVARADSIGLSDVTLRGVGASAVYGVVAGNPSYSTPLTVNTLGVFGGHWEAFTKSDGSPVEWGGLRWSVSADALQSGSWWLTVADTDGTAYPPPLVADLTVLLKSGTNWAAYEFPQQAFDATTYGGQYEIAFTNRGGQLGALSHMDVYLRDGSVPETPDPIPEPGSMVLLATGLFGLAAAVKRRKK